MNTDNEPIKAITLWQPWATLVALGEKKIETRSWATSHRGPLVIHAAKRVPSVVPHLLKLAKFKGALERHGITNKDIPLGAVVAKCKLVNCVLITPRLVLDLSEQEVAFGNYTPGRYAWMLEDVQALAPYRVRGYQRLWNWTPPVSIEQMVIRKDTNLLVLVECEKCGHEHYFKLDSLPGGDEHCPYCEVCSALLPKPKC